MGPVFDVTFTPDDRGVVTVGADGAARVWDLATGRPLGEPFRHRDVLHSVAISPDGKTVATGSTDRTARLWKVPAPFEDEVERVVLWAQVLTAMELDPGDMAVRLDPPTWQQRHERLAALGGPPLP